MATDANQTKSLRLVVCLFTWVVTVSLLWTEAEEKCEEEGREEEENSGPDSRTAAPSCRESCSRRDSKNTLGEMAAQ